MKLIIKGKGQPKIKLWLPLNKTVIGMIMRHAVDEPIDFDWKSLFKELKRFAKKHHGFVLLDVHSKDGDWVEIRL
ncbi:MAG: hypothetical protein LKF69_02165 [Bacilli bacterium]|jgi:hypothetical protein|nr:hypothetical protein [Bacilli bacterium]MCH4235592.1 hypothetical protein [Bacilli bacterium]